MYQLLPPFKPGRTTCTYALVAAGYSPLEVTYLSQGLQFTATAKQILVLAAALTDTGWIIADGGIMTLKGPQ
jgi:hypothetical protein